MRFIVAARKGDDYDDNDDDNDDDDVGNDVGTRLIRKRTRFVAADNF